MISLLVSLFGVCLAPTSAAQGANLVGHWEGAIVLASAEQEVDIVMDFGPTDALVKGKLWFPMTLDGAHEVDALAIQGSHVSFSVHDAAGLITAFDGALSAEGDSLQGTMTESGKSIPFILHRVKATGPASEVPVYRLLGSGIELTRLFNNDVGNVRMLLLLSPTSFSSKMAVRLVERFVMDQINDPRLRVYVVWMAPDRPESEKLVRLVAALAPDPRITHFWSTDRSLATVFEPMLALYKPVSNPCMLFGQDRSWTSPPPLPDRIRQTPQISDKNRPDPTQRLNGVDLAADVRSLLAAKKAP